VVNQSFWYENKTKICAALFTLPLSSFITLNLYLCQRTGVSTEWSGFTYDYDQIRQQVSRESASGMSQAVLWRGNKDGLHILNGQLVSGGVSDSKLDKQKNSMKSQILFHVMPCRLRATRFSKNHSNVIFRIKQIYKIHLRLFDLEDEGNVFLQNDGNYWPFDTTLYPTCYKYFPSARRHVSLLTNTLFIGHRNLIA